MDENSPKPSYRILNLEQKYNLLKNESNLSN